MVPVCSGADTAIVAVHPHKVGVDAYGVEHVKIPVTVANIGTKAQDGNTLADVVMFQDGDPADAKGLMPLRAGASQTVTFAFKRSAESDANSTALRFTVHYVVPSPAGNQDCVRSNDTKSIDF